jgi:RNA polymerase sigma-70 factor, ECF subfamily
VGADGTATGFGRVRTADSWVAVADRRQNLSGVSSELDRPDLVQSVRAGDRAAISHVLESCRPSLRRIITSRFHFPSEDCDDILQEVQLAFLLAAPRFRGECSLHTYLVQIACRKCADRLRARRREAPYWQQTGPDEVAAQHGTGFDGLEGRLAVQTAQGCLSPRELQLLDLFYRQEKSYREIAQAMGLAIGSVGAMKAEAILKLRVALGTSDESPPGEH